jgi:hypothetical protein
VRVWPEAQAEEFQAMLDIDAQNMPDLLNQY